MINKVILLGNAGKDAEVRDAGSTKVTKFSLATSESYKDKNGEWQSKSEWHNIVIWGDFGAKIAGKIKKGVQLYVEGKIQTRSWDDNGQTKYMTEINANQIQILDKKTDGDSKPTTRTSNHDAGDDGLPF